jgi:hypothetical protein
MQFFLDQIAARILAIYLCVYCGRKLWYGLVERKIAYWNDDVIDWLLIDWLKSCCSSRCYAGPVLDTNRPPDNMRAWMPGCCDIWVVAARQLMIGILGSLNGSLGAQTKSVAICSAAELRITQ